MEIWACEKRYITQYLQKKENQSPEDIKALALFQMPVVVENENRILSIDGENAVINISGILSKNGPSRFDIFYGYGGTGYDEIIDAKNILIDDESIKNVSLEVSSPGGRVVGVDEAYQAIADLAKVKKVTVINTGMVASAAYWIVSPAKPIYSTSPVNETGSIGVVVVGIDWTKNDEKYGIKEVIILSKNAENKYAGVETEKGIAEIQRQVDAIERVFLKRVADGRGITTEEVIKNFGKGGLLIAQDPGKEPDAITVNMIDGLIDSKGITVKSNNSTAQSEQKINPANADNKKPEGSMDLKEAMEKYPAIVAQVTLLEQEAKAAGTNEANEEFGKISAQVALVFDSETPYPKAIQLKASDVLAKKADPSVLEAMIGFHDMQVEEKKAADALLEANDGETHTKLEDGKKTKKGVAATTEDIDAIAKADGGM